ncbi:hypothetical protein GCM10022235_76310 [Kribbella ginsengisoli]|uniref:Uncharacterized protein n=1 Tax=Kribbella ginsengisoli TaxID=363865 RepID=A0ABP6Z3G5_9ACTN
MSYLLCPATNAANGRRYDEDVGLPTPAVIESPNGKTRNVGRAGTAAAGTACTTNPVATNATITPPTTARRRAPPAPRTAAADLVAPRTPHTRPAARRAAVLRALLMRLC